MSKLFPSFSPHARRLVLPVIVAFLTMAAAPCRAVEAPANDNLANAQTIPTGPSFSVSGTDVGATAEAFEQATGFPRNPQYTATVWYSWTPSASGDLSCVTDLNNGFPSLVSFFKGPGMPSASNVVGSSPEFDSEFVIHGFIAGQQYFIEVTDIPGFTHSFVFDGIIQAGSMPTPTPAASPAATLTVKTPKVSRATGKVGKVFVELSAASANDLAITYKVGGTAVGGTDYKTLGGSVTVPAGQTSAEIKVKPLPGGNDPLGVKITLTSGDGYTLGSPAAGKVKIVGGQ